EPGRSALPALAYPPAVLPPPPQGQRQVQYGRDDDRRQPHRADCDGVDRPSSGAVAAPAAGVPPRSQEALEARPCGGFSPGRAGPEADEPTRSEIVLWRRHGRAWVHFRPPRRDATQVVCCSRNVKAAPHMNSTAAMKVMVTPAQMASASAAISFHR